MELKTEKATDLKIEIQLTAEPQSQQMVTTVNVSMNGESILDVNENHGGDTYPKREWIPTSKRLPDDDSIMLLTLEYRKGIRYLDIDKYTSDIGWNRHSDDEVIAWMPIPEPYREDEENDYSEKEL